MGKFAMIFGECCAAPSSGLLRTAKIFAPYSFSVLVDAGFPFAVMRPKSDALKTTPIVFLDRPITEVFGARRKSQVLGSIIKTVSVSMVDMIRWPFPIDVKPHKPVGLVEKVQSYLNISSRFATSRLAGVLGVPLSRPVRIEFPPKNPRRWVEIKQLTERVRGKLVLMIYRHLHTSWSWPVADNLASSKHQINYRRA